MTPVITSIDDLRKYLQQYMSSSMLNCLIDIVNIEFDSNYDWVLTKTFPMNRLKKLSEMGAGIYYRSICDRHYRITIGSGEAVTAILTKQVNGGTKQLAQGWFNRVLEYLRSHRYSTSEKMKNKIFSAICLYARYLKNN